jgi:hypothetical protein
MVACVAILLSACAETYQGGYYNPQAAQYNRQMTGTLVGAAAGALIGNAVTSGGNYNNYGYCPPVAVPSYGRGPLIPGYNCDPHFGMGSQIRSDNRRALYLQNHPFGW